jgi:hypothetical protein
MTIHALRPIVMLLVMAIAPLLYAAAAEPAPAPVIASLPIKDLKAVVVDQAALPATQLAAQELSDYLSKMRGAPLPVVAAANYKPQAHTPALIVGTSAAKTCAGLEPQPFKQEEWMLKSVPQGLIIAGSDKPGDKWSLNTEAGTALAAYTLMDDYLGIKWLWPGKVGEHVPLTPDAVIPALDMRQSPRFIIRSYSVGYSTYHTKQFRDDVRQWARRTRQGWVPKAVFGHSWYDTFDLKKGTAFKEHPEWFALVNGKRQPPQVCTTNPEVINQVVAAALASKFNIANISPSDGGGFCQCTEETKSQAHRKAGAPSCTSLDIPGRLAYDGKNPELSDRIFTYANTVARMVREKDPQKSVGMFAYTFYNNPPQNIKKLEPNLYLSFVSQAMALRDPLAASQWRQTIAGWHEKDAQMVLREGWGNHYLLDLPFMHYKQILTCIHDAAQMGFIASYGEGTKAFSTQGPNAWAVVRMLWDPSQDTSKVMDGYYTAAFGPAAQDMNAYYATFQDTLDANWEKRRFIMDTRGVAYVNLINSWQIILPLPTLDAAEIHLNAALAKAPAGSPYAQRLALCKQGHEYTKTLLQALVCYQKIAAMGVKMEFFSAALPDGFKPEPLDPALLQQAYELGQKREDLVLANRDLPVLDEGLLGFANDKNLRGWHQAVKRELKLSTPTRVNLELLNPEYAATKKTKP